jgi:Bacteriophage Lambda NinG protein
MTEECKECGKGFISNRPFQVFCDSKCKGAYHRRRYRQQAVEEAEERLANGHDRGTPEQRQRASEVVARIIERGQGRIVRRI